MTHHRENDFDDDSPLEWPAESSLSQRDGKDILIPARWYVEWTVHHWALVGGVPQRVSADDATYRLFEPNSDGTFRRYDLRPNESRILTADVLDRQLDQSIEMRTRHDGSLGYYPKGEVERCTMPDGSKQTYFTDPQYYITWRVLDTTLGPPNGPPGHSVHFAPPYAGAMSRVFVNESGNALEFEFESASLFGEARRRTLTARVLYEQLRLTYPLAVSLEEEADAKQHDRDLGRHPLLASDGIVIRRTSTFNRWTAFDVP